MLRSVSDENTCASRRVRVETFGEGRLLDDCGADDRVTEAHLLTSRVDDEQLCLFAGMEVGHERVAADRVEDLQLAGLDECRGQQQSATLAREARDPRRERRLQPAAHRKHSWHRPLGGSLGIAERHRKLEQRQWVPLGFGE